MSGAAAEAPEVKLLLATKDNTPDAVRELELFHWKMTHAPGASKARGPSTPTWLPGSTMEFQRSPRVPNLDLVREAETHYKRLASMARGTRASHQHRPKRFKVVVFVILLLFFVVPGIVYLIMRLRSYKERLQAWEDAPRIVAAAEADFLMRYQRVIRMDRFESLKVT